jgi:predicted secreted hydrolase
LRIAGVDHRVSGTTWIEHEFAHRELGPGDAGWNRYELQFDDGRELDARFTRDRAGNVVAVSGVFVSASGEITYLHNDDARVANVFHTVWRSNASAVTYPSLWSLSVPFAHLGLATVEVALDQEARDIERTPYYSGAVVVERVGPPEGDRGHGFVELTGYGAPVSL